MTMNDNARVKVSDGLTIDILSHFMHRVIHGVLFLKPPPGSCDFFQKNKKTVLRVTPWSIKKQELTPEDVPRPWANLGNWDTFQIGINKGRGDWFSFWEK